MKQWLRTDLDSTTILIRFLVGVVFVSEGIQKFIYPGLRGAGRFESIGIPFPEFNGYFVGVMETLCGVLVLAGWFTRFASVPLIIIMLVALFTTKLPILLGTGFWGFSLRELPHYGLLSMLHESRNDDLASDSPFPIGTGTRPLRIFSCCNPFDMLCARAYGDSPSSLQSIAEQCERNMSNVAT